MSEVRNTRDREPLSARSLILSLLLRTQPPTMRGSRLVQWRGLFGVAEGRAKKCARMAEWLERATARAGDDPRRLADAFIAGATALRLIRVDPLLPPELMPDGDPGDDLRTAYRAWERSFSDTLRAWFRS